MIAPTYAIPFEHGVVCSPHALASASGLAVLRDGGNALDAAVATNLTLGVVAPYSCGFGGDLFAIVWHDGVAAYNGSGRTPAAMTAEVVRAATGDAMPERGPLPITVPGAAEAWFSLLNRFGTRSFGQLATDALRYARDGFPITELGAEAIAEAREEFAGSAAWHAVYGEIHRPGDVLRQPDLGRTIQALADEGPDVYYRGSIAAAIAEAVSTAGGLMTTLDLAEHRGEWVEPLSARYRDVDVLELPPNTQGVAVLEALRILDELGPLPPDGLDRQHRLIEVTKLALADRDAHVTDPEHMRIDPAQLLSTSWVRERAALFDPTRAREPGRVRSVDSGTAYMCVADRGGMLVSLIQSNFLGFGSGLTVPRWGINLHDRGATFSLDDGHPNVVAPRKRTLHTLIPALALRDGAPWLAFGTMGGHGQAQTHVQLLARVVDDRDDVLRAISAPRWLVDLNDWSVTAEDRFADEVFDGLAKRGHRVARAPAFVQSMGHAHAIEVVPGGFASATDPRAEGAPAGF
jgi:gamma-glutamyltranspeptidase/glutathione hydrolase